MVSGLLIYNEFEIFLSSVTLIAAIVTIYKTYRQKRALLFVKCMMWLISFVCLISLVKDIIIFYSLTERPIGGGDDELTFTILYAINSLEDFCNFCALWLFTTNYKETADVLKEQV